LSYNGIDRFDLRKKIVEDIGALNQIQKTEAYKGQVGTSERTGAVIESRLSLQWFMDMKKFIGRNPAIIESVATDKIKFHPSKLKNTYSYWMDNIKDWCISRQLWWGQQIPAYYAPDGSFVVAATKEDALKQFQTTNPALRLTTSTRMKIVWIPGSLHGFGQWKFLKASVIRAIRISNYYYPTTTLVTGHDIIFFWVARMIMAGYSFKDQQPFKDVYFTGMVRDNQGRKMSKQLGNSPDLLGLIDNYGADAVRFGIMIASPAGNDILFDESSLNREEISITNSGTH
jgi:valyl-tRNA synthetase